MFASVPALPGSAEDMLDPEKGLQADPPEVPANTVHSNMEIQLKKVFNCARNKTSDQYAVMEKILAENEKQRRKLCTEKNAKGNTALHYAARAGNLETCKVLRGGGAQLQSKDEYGFTPMEFAARYGDEDRVEDVWKCMEWMMEINKRERVKEVRNNLNFVDRYIRRLPAEADEADEVTLKQHKDVLNQAIQNSNWLTNTYVVEKLCEEPKLDMSEQDRYGNTSIHLAALLDTKEEHKILDMFLNNDRLISNEELKLCLVKENKLGKTPFHLAFDVGNLESMKQLLEKMEQMEIEPKDLVKMVNQKDKNGSCPLQVAIEADRPDMIEFLTKAGAKLGSDVFQSAARWIKNN